MLIIIICTLLSCKYNLILTVHTCLFPYSIPYYARYLRNFRRGSNVGNSKCSDKATRPPFRSALAIRTTFYPFTYLCQCYHGELRGEYYIIARHMQYETRHEYHGRRVTQVSRHVVYRNRESQSNANRHATCIQRDSRVRDCTRYSSSALRNRHFALEYCRYEKLLVMRNSLHVIRRV